MTVNEFIFDTLESIDKFYIDNGANIKQLTPTLYKQYYNLEINKYYLDIIDNNAVVIIKLQNY